MPDRPRVSISNLAADARGFTSNAYLVSGARTVLVDAGANFDVVGAVGERTDDLDAVVLTHTHPDHVGNVPAVREAFDVETWGYDVASDHVDESIADGDAVRLGDHSYEALHTPGHAADHLCLHSPEAGVLFAGDLVFQGGSFGRTDLPGADRATLVESIDRVREAAGDDLRVMYAGHGPAVEAPARTLELAREMAAEG